MDNISNKTIKQFYYDTDNGKIIITKLEEKGKNWAEWWGHVEGYGKAIMLFGGEKIDNREDTQTADYCAFEYYDDIIDTKGA